MPRRVPPFWRVIWHRAAHECSPFRHAPLPCKSLAQIFARPQRGSVAFDGDVPKPQHKNKHARFAPGVVAAFVSRVLFLARVASREVAVIHLGRASPRASCGLPWSSGGQPSNAPLRGLAPDGVCHATPVTERAVGSYSTVSPLPGAASRPRRFAFLWHFPRGRPHRALPGILPCGARTFLPAPKRRAIA
jgi:hypothetical protein